MEKDVHADLPHTWHQFFSISYPRADSLPTVSFPALEGRTESPDPGKSVEKKTEGTFSDKQAEVVYFAFGKAVSQLKQVLFTPLGKEAFGVRTIGQLHAILPQIYLQIYREREYPFWIGSALTKALEFPLPIFFWKGRWCMDLLRASHNRDWVLAILTFLFQSFLSQYPKFV